MDIIAKLKSRAREGQPTKIIFPEGEDGRILEAAITATQEKLVQPVILGRPEKIKTLAQSKNLSLDNLEIIDPQISFRREKYADLYEKQFHVSPDLANKILMSPLFFAAMALKSGDVESLIAGAVFTSGEVETVAKEIIGLQPGISTPSSFFLMITPQKDLGEDGCLLFADASVNLNPNPEELADIAITTGNTAKQIFDWDPRVALLSFSTKGSSLNYFSTKVAKACEMAKVKSPHLKIDGELQGDSALVMATAQKKMSAVGSVAGRANVLIFPDLNSGNITYKLISIIGKTQALGPILQGYQLPLSDLSRGAKTAEIVNTIALLSTWVKNQPQSI
jgi:phosphate acetyltransferase